MQDVCECRTLTPLGKGDAALSRFIPLAFGAFWVRVNRQRAKQTDRCLIPRNIADVAVPFGEIVALPKTPSIKGRFAAP